MERFSQQYYRCGCCNEEFETTEAIQQHFQTEWHKETAILALMKEEGNGLEIYLRRIKENGENKNLR